VPIYAAIRSLGRVGIAELIERNCAHMPGEPEELADAWRARYRPIVAEVNIRARPRGNFDELHLVTLQDLLTERGIDLPLKESHRLVRAWHRLDPWPDVRTGLEALRRQRVTSALSNGHLALLVELTGNADMRFDCLLSAELAHAYKPAPESYLTAARLLDVEPAELMLVAAHPWDLEGARGWATNRNCQPPAQVRPRFTNPRRSRR
jgi:2-haloacid dehalogenase